MKEMQYNEKRSTFRMIHILIIEDSVDINQMIAEYLQKKSIKVTQAYSGTEGKLLFDMKQFDLVLMDLMLPGLTGEELMTYIRQTSDIPVIVLSAKTDVSDKVSLLSLGADDYMTKPFDLEELYARILVRLKKGVSNASSINHEEQEKIEYGSWLLDKDSHALFIREKSIPLTSHEFDIVELLMKRPKKVFTKQEIYELIWQQDYAIEDKTINVHISNIRNKIKELGEEDCIMTVWGIGFKMKDL